MGLLWSSRLVHELIFLVDSFSENQKKQKTNQQMIFWGIPIIERIVLSLFIYSIMEKCNESRRPGVTDV